MVLCCRPDHPLAGKKQIPLRGTSAVSCFTGKVPSLSRGLAVWLRRLTALRILHGEHFVTFDRDLAIRLQLDRRLREAHAAVRVVMEFDNIETIKQAAQIGVGVSVLPGPTVRREG